MMAQQTTRFASIGECMLEMQPSTDARYQQSYAGDTYNTAVYFARCSTANPVHIEYVTLLGDDPYSTAMCQAWQQENIHAGLVQRLANRLPGLYFIHCDPHGERQFYFYRSQSAARDLFMGQSGEALAQQLLSFDILYFSAITLAILSAEGLDRFHHCIQQARQQGSTIVFDNNYRPGLWCNLTQAQQTIQRFLPFVSIALPSFADAQQLFNDTTPLDTAERLLNYGIQELVVKQGEGGYLLANQHDEPQQYANPKTVCAVDTTAAGDAFNGAYLAARWVQRRSAQQAAYYAAQLASIVVQHPGAIIPPQAMSQYIHPSQ